MKNYWFITQLKALLRSIKILARPVIPTVIVSLIWYYVLYLEKRYFHGGGQVTEIIVIWIAIFAIPYNIILGINLNTVWGDWSEMKKAICYNDRTAFRYIRAKNLPPLLHTIMWVLGGIIITGCMSIHYPDPRLGFFTVSSITYFLVLMFFVTIELDDPCTGLFKIENIKKEWLEENAKKAVKKLRPKKKTP